MEPIKSSDRITVVRRVQREAPQKVVKVKVMTASELKAIEKKKMEAEKLRKLREKEERERKIQEQKEAEQRRRREQERLERERRNAEEQRRIREKEQKKAEALERKKKEEERKHAEKIKKMNAKKKEKEDEKTVFKKRHHVFRFLKTAFICMFVIGICGAGVFSMILYSWCQDIPQIDITLMQKTAQTSTIYDIDGNKLTDFSGTENRIWVDIEDVPKKILDTFVAVEDKRFYEHKGVDAKRFLSAVKGQLTGKGEHGGSTITQQLIKNVYLTNEVTYKRKAQEILMAFDLEKQMTKREILEAYVNIIYFGSANYGIKAAADDYLGKELDELTDREIAMLVGLPKNPNGYNPRRSYYEKKDMTAVNKRTDTVLYVMHEQGILNDAEYQNALNEKVEIRQGSRVDVMYPYPALVEYAISDVVKDMLKKEGLENTAKNRAEMENRLRSSGYSIYTTVDRQITDIMQDTISNWEDYPKVLDKKRRPVKTEDGTDEKPQVAAVMLDPSTGHILAMIGNRDEVTVRKAFNRATDNNMPIASTIKPLSVYAPAMENGGAPGSVTYNYRTKIEGYDNTVEYPGGSSPESPVTFRKAIVNSLNVSAARVLCNYVGYGLSKDYLMQLGVSAEHISENGSGLALGTSGISMLELSGAYQALANGGYYREPKAYTKVLDRNGEVVLDSSDYQTVRKVFSDETVWLMTDVLKDTVEEGTARKAEIEGVETAGKTGTHEDKCGAFAGYTGEYVSTIWFGSDAYLSLSNNSGGSVAVPIWTDYMKKIYEVKGINKPVIYEKMPEGIEECTICMGTGKLAGPGCPNKITDYFPSSYAPTENCNGVPVEKEHVTDELMGKIQLQVNHELKRQHDEQILLQQQIEQGLVPQAPDAAAAPPPAQ